MAKKQTSRQPAAKTRSIAFNEIGGTGLTRSGGVVREELLIELSGSRGKKLLREMSENDAIVGAFLFAVESEIRQVAWKVVPGDDSNDARQKAAFVDGCREDMSSSWAETMTEVLSMLVFGFSPHEIIYKRRGGPSGDASRNSRYTDGLIGWRKMPVRAQETVTKWTFDKWGGVGGVYQRTEELGEVFIPIDRLLIFRTKTRKNNPEGWSVLRNAYRAWVFKKRIEEIEGIGVERDLAGMPVLTAPEGLDLWDPNDPLAVTQLKKAEELVRGIRRDQHEGLLLPFGWVFDLATTGGRTMNTTEIINRYDQRIAMTVLADFILLGHSGKFGSFALSKSKTTAFTMSMVGYLNMIRDVFNRYAIPRLFQLNGFPLDVLPKLDYGQLETPDLSELGAFIRALTGAQIDLTDETLRRHLLQLAGLPADAEDVAKLLTSDPVEDALLKLTAAIRRRRGGVEERER